MGGDHQEVEEVGLVIQAGARLQLSLTHPGPWEWALQGWWRHPWAAPGPEGASLVVSNACPALLRRWPWGLPTCHLGNYVLFTFLQIQRNWHPTSWLNLSTVRVIQQLTLKMLLLSKLIQPLPSRLHAGGLSRTQRQGLWPPSHCVHRPQCSSPKEGSLHCQCGHLVQVAPLASLSTSNNSTLLL